MEDLGDKVRREEPKALAREVLTAERQGARMSLVVDPCSWRYPNYGTQTSITLAGGGGTLTWVPTRAGHKIAWADLTREDLERGFDDVRLASCARCGGVTFDPELLEIDRNGLCESCHAGDLDARWGRVDKARALQDRRLCARAWARGHRWRVQAWVHPGDADDFPLWWFSPLPVSTATVVEALTRARSMVLDDFTVHPLDEPPAQLPSCADDLAEAARGVSSVQEMRDLARTLGGQLSETTGATRACVVFADQSRAWVDLQSWVVVVEAGSAR